MPIFTNTPATESRVSNTNFTPKQVTMEAMNVAVQWMTQNCSSNSDLATLSNVCKSWRNTVCETLCQSLIHHHNDDDNNKDLLPVNSLLLPCMIQQFISQNTHRINLNEKIRNNEPDSSTFCLAWFAPEGMDVDYVNLCKVPLDSAISGQEESSYSSAFAFGSNSGTGRSQVRGNEIEPLDKKESSKDASCQMGMRFETTLKNPSVIACANESNENLGQSNNILCKQAVVKVWKGLKNHMDVLIPFDYTNHFVTSIVTKVMVALEIPPSSTSHNHSSPLSSPYVPPENNQRNNTNFIKVMSTPSINRVDNDNKQSNILNRATAGTMRTTTIAVRGSTEARPEGLPWDAPLNINEPNVLETLENLLIENNVNNNATNSVKISQAQERNTTKNEYEPIIEKKSSNISGNKKDIIIKKELEEEEKQRLTRRQYQKDYDISRQRQKIKKMIKEMRDSLPRLVMSSHDKNRNHLFHKTVHSNNSDINQNTEQKNDCKILNFNDSNKRQTDETARQKSVQFLNANGSKAVRMRTRPFECGLVTTPVTLFCVGIATEDGSFLSGLRRRLELGHLYPTNARDEMIDMSSICIGIDHHSDENGEHRVDNSTNKNRKKSEEHFNEIYNPKSNDSDFMSLTDGRYNDNDSHNSSSWEDDSEDDIDESSCESSDAKQPPFVIRGKTGPGRWHCYTAIFNGERSVIRVDGLPEVGGEMDAIHNQVLEDSKLQLNKKAVLDGLTLGSDHSFDMTLCYGGGDPGEGEGAISEIVLFKGMLPNTDLIAMERYLMNKHGISHAMDYNNETTQLSLWQEDEWNRQAHALILSYPPFNDFSSNSKRIPLKVLAKHRTVAWERRNEVSGENVNVSRIGSKFSTGSSDW